MSALIESRSAMPIRLRDLQVRRIGLDPDQIRMSTDEKTPFVFEGYAIKWDSVNYYDEQFVRGAFADLIASGKKIHMYYNHGWRDWIDARARMRIGKWLELKEDDVGLYVKGELTPKQSLAEDVGAMLRHGTIDGLSIAFYDPNPIDVEVVNGVRRIKRIDLYEISPVDDPADDDARINQPDFSQVQSTRDAATLLGLPVETVDALLSRFGSGGQKPPVDTKTNGQADPLAWLDDFKG